MSHKKKLHIIGAKGNLATILTKVASKDFDLYLYSSKISSNAVKPQHRNFFKLDDALVMVGENEPVVFLSHSNDKQISLSLQEYLRRLSRKNPHLIYISSLAIYSKYKSTYSEIKLELEDVVQTFDNFSIVRLGFVYGRSFGGYSQVFKKLAKRLIVPLPSAAIKTGFISQKSACTSIIQAALGAPTRTISDVYEAFINFEEAINLFGFSGKAIKMPNIFLPCFLSFFQLIRYITPHTIQSLISIAYLDRKLLNDKISKPYLRCFLMRDYAKLFGSSDKWQLRKYLREIECNNLLSDYTKLSKYERFLYLYRIKEIMQVERDQSSYRI